MEQIKETRQMIDPFIVEEIKKSCPKEAEIRPSDIVRVSGGGYALEVKDKKGNREAIYYFDHKGKLVEMDAFNATLAKTSKGKEDVYLMRNKGGRA